MCYMPRARANPVNKADIPSGTMTLGGAWSFGWVEPRGAQRRYEPVRYCPSVICFS
ncbi:hypothetical protein M427DRAFT_52116 [Gonapodya prolifera JEL478]|uniref:Uncharacterized protein n=1 Tax=Gonapodya prolifera (strain JEL478) TaxID=1344416 RepID=A0A139AUV7_GONPJ|nr:hypothetical protein M427DRAFT_52116 [Gonapodya prolifera JEL478]|eukprot:KXS20511.1 hypothetical protein M427DRAFT_52116 [Gonapodya prolifera JEL478]